MKYCLQLLFILFIQQSLFSQAFIFIEPPDWVKESEIPQESSVTKYEVSSGYYMSLVDCQINLQEDEVYNREVRNVISYSGITEASQISVVFDTSYNRLHIHHLYIWRNGKKIDRTAEVGFEILSNEYALDQGIYNGHITAYSNLDDVRKDDQIDFAYSIIGSNPIFEHQKFQLIPLDVLNSLDQYSVRILYSKDEDYIYKCVDCDSIDVIYSEGLEYKEIEIVQKNLAPITLEEAIPSWQIPYKYFTLSSMDSWIEVYDWAQGIFELENEPDLEEVFSEIFSGDESRDEKINKMIRFVQNDIRYMGIESGLGSIKPFPPEQVLKQRFGDCKDKSLLLVSMLKKIGLEKSYPALVNTSLRQEIASYYPNNQIFNHCIVTFECDDTLFWVDPTHALQGGDFRDLYTSDYGKSLIVGMSSDSLQDMNPENDEGCISIVEELRVSSYEEAAELKITSGSFGIEADSHRAILEYYSVNDLSDDQIEELKGVYPSVEKKSEIEIIDDMENNSFTAIYTYEVDDFWMEREIKTGKYWVFSYEPVRLYQYLGENTCIDREFDFELIYPLNFNYKMIFHFPEETMIYDDFDTFENDAFLYEEAFEQLSAKSFQIDYTFRIKANFIKAEDYKSVCEEINAIVNDHAVVIYFPQK